LGGQVQVLFGSTSLTIEQIRAGKLRALAVTGAARWEGLSDIPTVGDFVPGYEGSAVFGLGAPKKTPRGASWLQVELPSLPHRCPHPAQRAGAGLKLEAALFSVQPLAPLHLPMVRAEVSVQVQRCLCSLPQ